MLKLDDYTLEKFLGKGTFGEVYLTKKFNSNNLYATKRMERKMVDDPRYIKYFKNEITILKRLFHNNIIRLEELKMTNNHYYIIMEYCNGGSLSDCLKRYKELYHHPFTEQIVQHIMRQVISAVKYMHSQGIIHRDLKLDNILVNFNNVDDFNSINLINSQIKIIDFGFASSKEDNKLFSTAIGSPLNMDPLILKKFNNGRVQSNDLYYDEKADIWSLGALCYEMLIGNCPFDAYNMEELLSKIEEGTYKVPTNFSREVVSFLNGMLQYNPQKRLTAENLSNHSFLTKNVNNFTKINTNMISRKVYGGQLNINIKNNQSIWAIFNEESQNELDNVPINNYMEVSPISESLYYPNEDNTFGITTEQTNYNQNYQNNYYNNQVNSVPIFGTNSIQNFINSQSPPPPANEDKSNQNFFNSQSPPPPANQENYFTQVPNKNNSEGLVINPPKQKKTNVVTFRNLIYENNQNEQIYNNNQYNKTPINEYNSSFKGFYSDNNNEKGYYSGIEKEQPSYIKKISGPQLNTIKVINQMPYYQNQQNIVNNPQIKRNQTVYVSNTINPMVEPKTNLITLAQNPIMVPIIKNNSSLNMQRLQVPQRQLKTTQAQRNLASNPNSNNNNNIYSIESMQKNTQNINRVQKRKIIRVIKRSTTPSNTPKMIYPTVTINPQANLKSPQPKMFFEKRIIRRVISNPNLLIKNPNINNNFAKNGPQQKKFVIQIPIKRESNNKILFQRLPNGAAPQNLGIGISPQKQIVMNNMNLVQNPGHFVVQKFV